ncbi:MAG TPA: hypothetical protein VF624_15760 [Tepidisphaeraceae bacterium]|jgi:hypothetical protein
MPRNNEIRNRDAIFDLISDVLIEQYRSTTVDKLHSRPIDALEMHIEVGIRASRVTRNQAKLLRRWIAACPFSTVEPGGVIAELNEIGRAAFAGRKLSKLKRRDVA